MAKKPKTTVAAAGLKYLGPNSVLELEGKERQLVKGRTYADLPTDHPIVANLIAEKLLVEPKPDPVPEKPTDAAPADEPAPFTGNEF